MNALSSTRFLVIPFVLLGCITETTTDSSSCRVEISDPTPPIAESGDVLEITGHPLTTHFDTAAYLDAIRASVIDVDRSTCDDCDSCRSEEGCNGCEDCDACDALCDETCIETISLVVPEVSAGIFDLRIYNSYGQSNAVQIEIAAPSDDDTGHPLDTGSIDDTGETQSSDDTAQDTGSASDTASETIDSGTQTSNSNET